MKSTLSKRTLSHLRPLFEDVLLAGVPLWQKEHPHADIAYNGWLSGQFLKAGITDVWVHDVDIDQRRTQNQICLTGTFVLATKPKHTAYLVDVLADVEA